MANTSSTTTKSAAAKTAAPDTEPAEQQDETAKPSTTVTPVGGFVLYRHPSAGPVMALVTTAGTGEAEVLVMRDSEVPRARAVTVYDSAEDAERGAAEGLQHVAYHLP